MGNIAGDILLLLSIDPVYTQGTPFILGGEISNIIESPKKSWFECLFLHFFILLLLIYIINWFSQDLAPPILLQNRKYIVWNKYKYIKKKLNFQKDIWNPLRNLYFFFRIGLFTFLYYYYIHIRRAENMESTDSSYYYILLVHRERERE